MGEGKDNAASLSGTRRLADAIRQAKMAAAHRSDVVVDIREADRARLEILRDELQPLIDDLPDNDDVFDFVLAGGSHPRIWIDGTAHVMMARDRRTYRLVRETRLGRVLIAESSESRVIADRVTDYVAERLVEREKAFAAEDGVAERVMARADEARDRDAAPLSHDETRSPERQRNNGGAALLVVFCLLVGALIGAGALFGLVVWQGLALR